jgi:type II secretory pathway component GspD/PulD (secretin)
VLHVTVKINTLKSTDPESGLPVVSLRSADVTARVKDGETIAVAGLELAEESRESRRVPVLSSLPLIGGLFRAPSRSRSETHLAVFITPHVIRGAEASPSSPGPTDRAQLAAQGGSRHG